MLGIMSSLALLKKKGTEAAELVTNVNPCYVTNDIPECFGKKWAKQLLRIRCDLIEAYGDKLKVLLRLSLMEFEYSKYSSAAYVSQSRKRGFSILNKPHTIIEIETPEGYADYEGWAYTLYNGASEITEHSFLKTLGFENRPSLTDILDAAALLWFFDAANCLPHNLDRAHSLLFEVSDAINLAHGDFMWSQGNKSWEDEINVASILAKKRHTEHYALKEHAAEYWRKNIDPNLSASKAANELLQIVPLSHKTLAAIVSAAKKNQHR